MNMYFILLIRRSVINDIHEKINFKYITVAHAMNN
jgi:hypothetical protein